ncbi:hypothetical protein GLOIN_2v1483130 [Rhizophagus irregularis DAOM 181602=DAOM 197198]|nr:hypothetical protein GLOIN_2v1483130 [Rhizophagus irregularis DAOM 181602=DAOM 197198]
MVVRGGRWTILKVIVLRKFDILSKEIARNREGECLSEKYVYNKALILWKYAKDHLWSANLNCVKNRKTWCPWCAVDNRRSRTIEDMKKFAEKKRVFALQSEYINWRNPLEWQS